VRLELQLEVSRIVPSIAGDIAAVGPTIQQRRLDASILVHSGETVLIGESLGSRVERLEASVPFLSSIPVLGALFRSTRDTTVHSHLVIAVVARRLPNPEDRVRESARRRVVMERHLEGLSGLQAVTDAPYALLIGSYPDRPDAMADMERLEGGLWPRELVSWRFDGDPRFDVYLTGFQQLAEAMSASFDLREEGWDPEIVVIP
jgi:hypothetical protein